MAEHRYRVIKRLEAGGMAEVYLGEATGVEGFKKRVAIKRVLPNIAQNDNFIHMFLDEARLSARLSHANIFSVWDRVFGTYTSHIDFATLRYGLDAPDDHDTFVALLRMPF